jgi:hypothetical protein
MELITKLSGLLKATEDRPQFYSAKQSEIHIRSELGAANYLYHPSYS